MSSERDFELAAEIAERQRQAGVARARRALLHADDERPMLCDCGEPIGEARRRAVPGTDKCVQCATFLEKRRRRAR